MVCDRKLFKENLGDAHVTLTQLQFVLSLSLSLSLSVFELWGVETFSRQIQFLDAADET